MYYFFNLFMYNEIMLMYFVRYIICIKFICIFLSQKGNDNSNDIKGFGNYKEGIERKKIDIFILKKI